MEFAIHLISLHSKYYVLARDRSVFSGGITAGRACRFCHYDSYVVPLSRSKKAGNLST